MARTRVRGSQQLNADLVDLNDTPSSYTGSGDYLVKVKSTTDGIEFVDKDTILPPVTWVNDIYTSDGSQRVYTLSSTPNTDSVIVTLEGMALSNGALNDYTISGTTLTLNASVPLESGMKIDVTYVSSDGIATPGLRNWFIVDENYSAVNGDRMILDATAGLEITLPTSPSLSDEVYFLDGPGNFASTLPVIKRNGEKIMRLSEDLIINVNNAGFRLVYSGSTWGWIIFPNN